MGLRSKLAARGNTTRTPLPIIGAVHDALADSRMLHFFFPAVPSSWLSSAGHTTRQQHQIPTQLFASQGTSLPLPLVYSSLVYCSLCGRNRHRRSGCGSCCQQQSTTLKINTTGQATRCIQVGCSGSPPPSVSLVKVWFYWTTSWQDARQTKRLM